MTYIEIQPFYDWYEYTIEDFCDNICPHLGLSVNPKDVQFSGFCSQGDGASFTGNFCMSDVNPANLKATCPAEVELHQLVEELAELAEAHPEIQGSISRMSSLYSHSNTMIIGEYDGYCNEDVADAESSLIDIFRQLADWLYSRLESEYNFQLADATVSQWVHAVEERKSLQLELEQLKVDVAANPPSTLVQAKALTSQIEALGVEVESLTSTIDQLADQFRYWEDGKAWTVEQFHEQYYF